MEIMSFKKIPLVLLIALFLPATGTLVNILDRCCELGKQWHTQSQQKCSVYPSTISDLSAADRRDCVAVIEVCCLAQRQLSHCYRGKLQATTRNTCDGLQFQVGTEDARECCHCCKLGRLAQEQALSCDLFDRYGPQCRDVFRECCDGGSSVITTTPPLAGGNLCDSANPCQHRCVEVGEGAIICKCNHGYSLQPDGTSCGDIDECSLDPNRCQAGGEMCENLLGSFQCRKVSDGGNALADDSRTPVESTPKCSNGFIYHRQSRKCEDIDECSSERTNNCQQSYQICRNTLGSYRCDCHDGFQYDSRTRQCEDLNECAMRLANCLGGQICENTVGSYHCRRFMSCGTGYTLDTVTQRCIDDDECTLGTHNCDVTRECRNIVGSFRCVTKGCQEGYKLDSSTGRCKVVNCERGYKPDHEGNCIDINECVERQSVCRASEECLNTIGSYNCRSMLTCRSGFEVNEGLGICEDIDECDRGTHDCLGELMSCVNNEGSYVCQCPEGYVLNSESKTCDDVDECLLYELCSTNARCENTQGSFICMCKEGFEAEGDGQTCRDVDECAERAPCDQRCRNTWGSYQCYCNEGYQLSIDQQSCEDFNECSNANVHGARLCLGICENTDGSFRCQCPHGFRLRSDGRTCDDIDECTLSTANCNGADDLCINTRGDYRCRTVACPVGFVRVPSNSARVTNVQCQRRSFACRQGDVECLTAPLSYSHSFMTFSGDVRVPAELFTLRGPRLPDYRRAAFNLTLLVPASGSTSPSVRVNQDYFRVRIKSPNEAVVEILRKIDDQQDVDLQLDMNIYSTEFSPAKEEFFGTIASRISLFVTIDTF